MPTKAGGKQRQRTTPKQPLPVADRLKRLFTSLCAQIDGGYFANAIKTCDKSMCPLIRPMASSNHILQYSPEARPE